MMAGCAKFFKKNNTLAILFLSALAIGIALRLYQFADQILIDDEWHAVYQLIEQHRPMEIFLSFGVYDYCIPLTLLYWLETSWFGLSEFGMRWPMLLCGSAALILFPLYIWRTLGARYAILFAFLLAISPVLVLYSRIARPYALTVLLVYLAHYAFDRYCHSSARRPLTGALYGTSAIFAIWMHLVAGPMVVAPLLYQCGSLFLNKHTDRKVRIRLLLQLGLPTVLGMALLVGPPLTANVSAIAGKSSVDSPNLQTVIGALHWWVGSGSTAVVVLTVLLAALGFPTLWRRLPLVRTIAFGLLLTLLTLLLMRPAWIHNPITFGRYLLPVIPLLLLSVAAGTVRLADFANQASLAISRPLILVILAFPVLSMAAQSPLREILLYPNSNIANPFFYFDFRPEHNPLPTQFDRYAPLSSFWSQLGVLEPGSMRIAAAPFYYESHNWDAPRWERISRQHIVPAYLSGLCAVPHLRELPNDVRFKFRNVVFVSDDADLALKEIDMITFRKPFMVTKDNGTKIIIGDDTRQCESALRNRFGQPVYEDEKLVVFTAANNLNQNNDK
jgi:hypothetical protein